MAVAIEALNGVEIEALNDAQGLTLLGQPNMELMGCGVGQPNMELLGQPNMELMGAAMGLGASLSETDIKAMAKELAPQTQIGGGLSSMQLAALLSNYDRTTQQKLGAAIIAEGGDAGTVGDALKRTQNASNIANGGPYGRKGGTWGLIWGLASTASAAASAYHGYKRNDSVGWAIWWFLMGGLFPVITPAIALAQGFGKEKGA